MILRFKKFDLTPFDAKYANGQTKDHNVLSTVGHEWEVCESGQTRTCQKCFRQECSPPDWVPIPSITFSKEDILALIKLNEEKKNG